MRARRQTVDSRQSTQNTWNDHFRKPAVSIIGHAVHGQPMKRTAQRCLSISQPPAKNRLISYENRDTGNGNFISSHIKKIILWNYNFAKNNIISPVSARRSAIDFRQLKGNTWNGGVSDRETSSGKITILPI